MIKAIAIDSKGKSIGISKIFTNQQWNILTQTYGKKLRWELLEIIEEKSEFNQIGISKELEKIHETGSTSQDDLGPEFSDYSKEDLEQYTKRELIEKYELSEDFMKKSKSKIIEEISRI